MFERFKRSSSDDAHARRTSGVATADRPAGDPVAHDDPVAHEDRPVAHDDRGIRRESTVADDRTTVDDRTTADDRTIADDRTATHHRPLTRTGNGVATASALETARARQRDEFGGMNWGASFFGWLVAVGVATLLTALLVAAGAAIGLTVTEAENEVTTNTEEVSFGGAIALIVVLMIAYYTGGYVAGRMSRFDGGRQGLGTWVIGLIVTVAVALAAVILGDEYNLLEQLNLPSLPVGDQTFATGGIIALAAIALGSLLAAMFGGKVGERYHKRVDRAGFVD
jgi:hypothetical protein